VFSTKCAAADFQTKRLKDIAYALRKNDILNNAVAPNTQRMYEYKGKKVRVKTGGDGAIANIGYYLFNDDIYSSIGNTFVLDFLERYILELDLAIDGKSKVQRMSVDNVTIIEGDISLLHQINANSSFSINHLSKRMYKVTWQLNTGILTLSFPADCQLIFGADIIELEDNLIKDITKVIPKVKTDFLFDVEGKKVSRADNVIKIQGEQYLISAINNTIYVKEVNGRRMLLCDEKVPTKSVSNIVLTGIFKRLIPVTLKVNCYGYQKKYLDVTLQQIIDYCLSQNSKLFFGIKKNLHDKITGTLFVLNEQLGFNHVLSVEFPKGILKGSDEKVTGSLMPYIPINQINDSFFSRSKDKEYEKY